MFHKVEEVRAARQAQDKFEVYIYFIPVRSATDGFKYTTIGFSEKINYASIQINKTCHGPIGFAICIVCTFLLNPCMLSLFMQTVSTGDFCETVLKNLSIFAQRLLRVRKHIK